MKTKEVSFHKVFNLGDYSNEKIEVRIEVEEGDNVQDVVNSARDFVENQHKLNKQKGKYLEACSIIENDYDYTGKQIAQAKQIKDDYESMLTNTPKLLS